jgi:RNA-binding protein
MWILSGATYLTMANIGIYGEISKFKSFGNKFKAWLIIDIFNALIHIGVQKELTLEKLVGFQKTYLRGLAHTLKPIVLIGKNGLTATQTKAIDDALEGKELVKIKFIDFKEKEQKQELLASIETDTHSEVVGQIGHTAILFRLQKDTTKRKIKIPAHKPAAK